MNEQLGLPIDPFSVGIVGDPKWLHDIAQNLLRVDLVQDERSGSTILSRTRFSQHPIFSSELTSLHAMNWGARRNAGVGTPRFNLHSFVSFSEDYRNQAHMGYIPTEKVAAVAETLTHALPQMDIRFHEGRKSFPQNYINIKGNVAGLHIDFDEPSLDAKLEAKRRSEEMRKEMDHPEGRYYKQKEEYMAKVEAERPVQTPAEQEEEKVWVKTWQRKTREIFETYPDTGDPRHELITIKLEGLTNGDVDGLLESMVGGTRLTSPEGFRAILEFYVQGYASVINAFCEIESVQPPKPRVLIGSGILK